MLSKNLFKKGALAHSRLKPNVVRSKLPALLGACMMVVAGGCAVNDATTGAPPAGVWHVDYIEGAGVVDRSPARYQFDEDLRVTGNASCNSFTGAYQIVEGAIVVGNLASTRMMCPPALMEQEQRLLAAMQRVHRWDTQNGLLYLFDKEGQELFRGGQWVDAKQ